MVAPCRAGGGCACVTGGVSCAGLASTSHNKNPKVALVAGQLSTAKGNNNQAIDNIESSSALEGRVDELRENAGISKTDATRVGSE